MDQSTSLHPLHELGELLLSLQRSVLARAHDVQDVEPLTCVETFVKPCLEEVEIGALRRRFDDDVFNMVEHRGRVIDGVVVFVPGWGRVCCASL
jgi:hypothetical protein